MITRKISFLSLVLLQGIMGCTPITPEAINIESQIEPGAAHRYWDKVLGNFVSDSGLVDYEALKQSASDLEKYYQYVSKYSPDSHPDFFPTEKSRLAYWINAYNASAIKAVLHHYPIKRVTDIKPPFPFFFLTDKAGFFLFQRIEIGGRRMSLYGLENKIIRKRFSDPRVHFALNCASMGCPQLPKTPFSASLLDEQLDQEARAFVNNERNFNIDHQKQVFYLSSIFKWYQKDFVRWFNHRFPEKKATLLNYIGLYLSSEKKEEVLKHSPSYKIDFIPYDWRLNDRLTASDLPGSRIGDS